MKDQCSGTRPVLNPRSKADRNADFHFANTLTPILKKLEAMGYLERMRDPIDERQVRIRLTKSGKRVREKVLPAPGDPCGLSPKDFARLQKEIVTLRSNLIEAANNGDWRPENWALKPHPGRPADRFRPTTSQWVRKTASY